MKNIKQLVLITAGILILLPGCIQVNIPKISSKKVTQYTLVIPADHKVTEMSTIIAEFVSDSPAKFKMLSRKGTELQFDSFAKWTLPPSVMISSVFRKMFGCDDANDEYAKYILEGNVYTFERNLDTKTADLKIQYTLLNRADDKVIFQKQLSTAVPLVGMTPDDFAVAMSRAVVLQAEEIRQEIIKLEKKK